MPRNDDEQLSYLLSHADELCERAVRGNFTHTDFLTPREQLRLHDALTRRGQSHRALLWGGYPAAERRCLLLFPDYVLDALGIERADEAQASALLAMVDAPDPVASVFIRSSGYRTLSHRDYLGSLLSLGLARDVLGDIAVSDEGATLLCRAHMAEFLLTSLERIGGDAVRVSRTTLSDDFDGGRRFVRINDTVASPRLDCVVAALANLSRDAAQASVRDGLVEWNYEIEQRPDHSVEAPGVLSVRGVGKFTVLELGTLTKKGRMRLVADKYI